MAESKHILIKPLITEKMTRVTTRSGNKQYGFLVNPDANKIEIKKAIEDKYEVVVDSIRTLITPRKERRRFAKGRNIIGQTDRRKKAFITLREASEIDFYKNT